jgi:hypothetical protein
MMMMVMMLHLKTLPSIVTVMRYCVLLELRVPYVALVKMGIFTDLKTRYAELVTTLI